MVNWYVRPIKKIPSSRRYCVICDRVTTFHFDRHVFHSCCYECGSQQCMSHYDAIKLLESKIKNTLLKHKEYMDIQNQLEELKSFVNRGKR